MGALTGSKAALAQHCLFPFRPDVVWPADTVRHPNAAIGSALAAAQAATINRRPGFLAGRDLDGIAKEWTLPEHDTETFFDLFDAWQRDVRPLVGWRAEVTLAYAPATDTGREIGVDMGRDYSGVLPGEIPMTADVVSMGVDADGPYVEVRDTKTGRQTLTIGRTIADHVQLRVGALAAARAFGVDRARIVLDLVTPDGVESPSAMLDAIELDAIASDVAGWLDGIPTAETKPGLWCDTLYCPIRATCPKGQQAVAEVIPAAMLTRHLKLSTKIENVEHFEWTRGVLAAARAALDAVEEATHAYADERGGVELSDGSVFRRWEEAKRSLDASVPGALDLIADAGAASLVKPALTIGALEKGIGKADAKELLTRLQMLGAVTVKPSAKYEARKPKGRAA